MDKLAEMYQKGIARIKAKDYQRAMEYFERVFQENTGFLSVCYYLGKCHYFLREFDEAEEFLTLHTESDTKKNQGQAWKLLTKIHLRRRDKEKAASSLQQASEHGAVKLAGLRDKIAGIEEASFSKKMRFRFLQLAKNKTPIAKTDLREYEKVKFFINGMTDEQRKGFCDGKWHELEVTKPKKVKFKGFMSVALLDDRGYYRKYLPKLGSLYLRSSFNDYLEEDRFFKNKWEKSRVFALLLTKIFSREMIERLLIQNDLLDTQARRHLKGCDDLVYLKKQGEVMPLSSEPVLENAE